MTSSPSPTSTALQLIHLSSQEEQDSLWRRIYTASNAVVLYNPTSHALAVRNQVGERDLSDEQRHLETSNSSICPYCRQKIQVSLEPDAGSDERLGTSRAPNYFHLLSLANDANSRPSSRPSTPISAEQRTYDEGNAFPVESIAQGYFSTFFKEEYRLGMGANGSVYLCQVGSIVKWYTILTSYLYSMF